MSKVIKIIKAYNVLGTIKQEEWEQTIKELQEQDIEYEVHDNYNELQENELDKRTITISSVEEKNNNTLS